MELTGIILAGGKSSRMGQDKGLTDFRGKPLIQYSIDILKQFTDQILISSNNPEYIRFGYPLISDIYQDCGPIGGLHATLSASKTDWNVVLGCDTPFIKADLILSMTDIINNQDAIIPKHQRGIEPLSGIYHKRTSLVFEVNLKNGKYKLQNTIKEINTEYFDVSELLKSIPYIFTNINTPDNLNI